VIFFLGGKLTIGWMANLQNKFGPQKFLLNSFQNGRMGTLLFQLLHFVIEDKSNAQTDIFSGLANLLKEFFFHWYA
jgi:hypothetical protein